MDQPKRAKHQTNVMTFFQTFMYGFTVLIFADLLCLLAAFVNKLNISISTFREIMFIYNILIFDLFYSVFVPIVILINLKRKMPEFYTKSNQVDVQKPNLIPLSFEPRNDLEFYDIKEPVTISKVIYVKSKEELSVILEEDCMESEF